VQSVEGVAWRQACFSNSNGHVLDISGCPEHLHSHSKVNLSTTNVELFFIDGAENPADLLTKNLPCEKFVKFRAQLGLQFPSGSI